MHVQNAKTKEVYDSDFLYDFPLGELFHDHNGDFNLDEQSDPVPYNPPPIKHSTEPAIIIKSTSAMAHSAPPLPLSAKDTGLSTLSFDQQLQLIKLQKEKLELEMKVLNISRQKGPHENMQADFPTLLKLPSHDVTSSPSTGCRFHSLYSR